MNRLAQVGPLLKSQAVTTIVAAAFSFALSTNLNTTPLYIILNISEGSTFPGFHSDEWGESRGGWWAAWG